MNQTDPWQSLGAVAPTALAQARLVLHHASQVASAPGTTLAAPRDDFSHTAFTWSKPLEALAGVSLDGGLHAALRPRDLTLLVAHGRGEVVAELPMTGKTLDEATRWLGERLGAKRPLGRPTHELPPHAVGTGAALPPVPAAELAELAAWFAGTQLLLEGLTAAEPRASPLRCWPHHFDLATLIALDPEGTPAEQARSIGVGLSPGDGSYPEPYLYVTPWPYPQATLPPLRTGAWHTQGWTGAVLQGSKIVDLATTERGDGAAAFAKAAVSACRRLLSPG